MDLRQRREDVARVKGAVEEVEGRGQGPEGVDLEPILPERAH